MNPMTAFQFHNTAVRVFPTEDGQSFWVVAKDVAEVLGYRDAANLIRQVPEKYRGTRLVSTPGGDQEMTVILEPGLYRAVARSEKPEAEPFMEWLTEDVLPSIRKTGAYVHPGAAKNPRQSDAASRRAVRKAINARAWALSQANYATYQALMLAQVPLDDPGAEAKVATWTPPPTVPATAVDEAIALLQKMRRSPEITESQLQGV